MNSYTSILLGFVQGMTEFLPVSSSGHLVIFQSLLRDFEQPGILFDVILHFATSLSVIYFFRKKIMQMSIYEGFVILIATIPAAFVGIFFESIFEGLFSNIRFVGVALLITGFINILIDRIPKGKKDPNIRSGFIVGVAQSFAIIPGISRSGSTIFTGRMFGLSKESAARFSFLLSVPAVLGATVFQLLKHGVSGVDNVGIYILGFIAAFVSGVLSIKVVINLLYSEKFKYFGIYCFAVGLFVLTFF